MSEKPWKSYEEIDFGDWYTLRWIREGDEYVSRMPKWIMEQAKEVLESKFSKLTNKKILEIADRPELCDDNNGLRSVIDFARAIEREHGIK